MRELGELREEEYSKVGEYIQEKGIDVLVTYGFRTEEIGEQAKVKGFSAKIFIILPNKEEVKCVVEKIVKRMIRF